MIQTMSSSRYDEIIDKVSKNIQYYEAALEDNKYFLVLANGDMINLTFPRNNLSHILGVHTSKLKTADIVKTTSSYETLKKLADSDLTYMGIQNTNNSFDISSLFSDYIDAKLEVFSDILKIRTDDMYCVVKYCSERSYTTSEEKENSNYFIIRRINKKYSVLGIVKNDNYTNYVPVTSRLFDNLDDLREFLGKITPNQEVTYPCSLRVDNYNKQYNAKYFTRLEDKLEYNKTLKDLAFRFNAIPSTNRDFLAIIENSLNNRQKINNNSSILNLIKESITSGNLIDKEEVKQRLDDAQIPSELEELIDACNDLTYSNCTNNESVGNSYSSIQNENTSLKQKLEELKKEILQLKEETNRLETENTGLKETNRSNYQKLKILTDAFESIKH